MPLPTPPVALKDHCSIIHDNTLYTYQVDAFQSLALDRNAKWSKLSMGVPTKGSTCVLGSVNGEDSLYVVGGATTSSTGDYSGLQKYTFASGKWESISPKVEVTKNRIGHGSAFLAASSQILIYSGSQDNNFIDSTQTFLISLISPYNVLSFQSTAPPVMNPLMMPYNSSHALMLGGESTNSKLYTFGPVDGWKRFAVNLPSPLQASTSEQATILQQSDGSKILEIFDTNPTPNQISTLLLSNATSSLNPRSPLTHSSPHARNLAQTSRKRKRQTPDNADRPPYNSTLAPQGSRKGFSLANGDGGLVVLSGGADDPQDVLAMFNETSNQWIDADAFFGNQKAQASPTPTTTSPSQSASGAAAASSSPAALPGTSNNTRDKSLKILGATLGTVFGIALILILILLILRRMRRKREAEQRHRSKEYTLDSKRSMDFADRGSPDMISDGGRHHRYKTSDMSMNSTYVMGAARAPSSQSKRSLFHKPTKSDSSSKPFFGRSKSANTGPSPPTISEPFPISSSQAPQLSPIASTGSFVPQSTAQPRNEPGRHDVSTTGGWSKYWANNSSTNIAPNPTPIGIGSGVPREASTYTSSTSGYTSSQVPSSKALHSSAEVDPLNLSTDSRSPPPRNPARSAGTVSTLSPANTVSHGPPGDDIPWPPPNTRTLTPGPFPGYPSNARPMSPTQPPLDTPSLEPGLAVTSSSPPHNLQQQPPSPTSPISDMHTSRSSSPHSDDGDRYRSFGRSAPPSWTPIDPLPRNNSFLTQTNDPYSSFSSQDHRPVSSIYSKTGDSVYYAHPGEKVRIPNFPGVPSRGPSTKSGMISRGPSKGHAPMEGISEGGGLGGGDMGMRTTASRDFGVGNDDGFVRTGEVRRGGGGGGAVVGSGKGAGGEDMSWLNLGR